eukprot:Sdes_comp20983_c0_seq1m19413
MSPLCLNATVRLPARNELICRTIAIPVFISFLAECTELFLDFHIHSVLFSRYHQTLKHYSACFIFFDIFANFLFYFASRITYPSLFAHCSLLSRPFSSSISQSLSSFLHS